MIYSWQMKCVMIPFNAKLTLVVGQQEWQKVGCWFVDGDDVTGALHVL